MSAIDIINKSRTEEAPASATAVEEPIEESVGALELIRRARSGERSAEETEQMFEGSLGGFERWKRMSPLEKVFSPTTYGGRVGSAIAYASIYAKERGITWKEAYQELRRQEISPHDLLKKVPDEALTTMGLGRTKGMPASPGVLRFALGTGAEILTDPTPLAKVGALTKAGKEAALTTSAIERAGKTLGEQAEAGERALLQIAGKRVIKGTPVFKGLSKLNRAMIKGNVLYWGTANRFFTSTTGNPVSDYLLRKSRDTKHYLQNKWIGAYGEHNKRFQRQAIKLEMPETDFNDAVIRRLERKEIPDVQPLGDIVTPVSRYEPTKKTDFTPKERLVEDAADAYRKINDDVFKTENANGVWVSPFEGDVEYWARITTPEAKEWLAKQGFGDVKKWSGTHANQLQRKFSKNLNFADANEAMRLEGFDGNFFITNPAVSGAVRADRAARAVAARQFIDGNLDYFTTHVDPETGRTFGAVVNTDKPAEIRKVLAREKDQRGLYVEKKALRDAGVDVEGNNIELAEISDLLKKQPDLLKGSRYKAYLLPNEVATELNALHTFKTESSEAKVLEIFDKAQNWWKAWTLGIFPEYHTRNAISNIQNNMLAGVYDPGWYTEASRLQYLARDLGEDLVKATPQERELVEAAKRFGVIGKGWYGADIEQSILDQMRTGSWMPSTRNKALLRGREVGSMIENNARLAHFMAKVDEGAKLAGEITDDVYENAALSVKKYLFDYADLTPAERNVMKRVFPFYTWTRKNLPLQLEHILAKPGYATTVEHLRQGVEAQDGYKEDARILGDHLKDNYPVRVRRRSDGTEEYATVAGWLPIGDLYKMANPFNWDNVAMGNLTPLVKVPLELAMNQNSFFQSVISKHPGETGVFMGVPMKTRTEHILRSIRLLGTVDRLMQAGEGQLSTEAKLTKLFTGFRIYAVDPERAWDWYEYNLQQELEAKLIDLERKTQDYETGRTGAWQYNIMRTGLEKAISELGMDQEESSRVRAESESFRRRLTKDKKPER